MCEPWPLGLTRAEELGMGNGAGGEDRTPDLRFTKPLHYRCATPADATRGQVAVCEAGRKFRTNGNIKCSSTPKPTLESGIVTSTDRGVGVMKASGASYKARKSAL